MAGFRIAGTDIDGRILLAPLSGITDSAFRRLCRRWGAAATFADMLSADGIVRRNARTLCKISTCGEERPVGAQLFGTDPGVMRDAAVLLEYAGFDFIDINAGCPVRKIVRRGAGSALAENPRLLGRLLHAMTGAVRIGVTVKLRPLEDLRATIELTRRVEECGAAAITVHGRLASRLHSGPVLVGSIAEVKSRSTIPVIANGGVVSPEGAARLLLSTGCDAVMIGRGCLGRPWLFHRADAYLSCGCVIEEPSYEERIDVCLQHLREALKDEDERFAVPRMRKHLGWYLKGMPYSARLRSLVFSEKSSHGVENILHEYRSELSHLRRSEPCGSREIAQSS